MIPFYEVKNLPRTYYGDLVVAQFAGKNARGERQFVCYCGCGAEVARTEAQLEIRKLQRCDACQHQRGVTLVDERRRERSKRQEIRQNRKHKRLVQLNDALDVTHEYWRVQDG